MHQKGRTLAVSDDALGRRSANKNPNQLPDGIFVIRFVDHPTVTCFTQGIFRWRFKRHDSLSAYMPLNGSYLPGPTYSLTYINDARLCRHFYRLLSLIRPLAPAAARDERTHLLRRSSSNERAANVTTQHFRTTGCPAPLA